MKKPIRLAVCDMWPGHDPKNCGIINLLRSRHDIEITDEPDFLLYSCFGDQHYRYKCIRIFYSGENVRPDWRECDYAFTFDYTDHPDHFRWPFYGLCENYGRDLIRSDDFDAEGLLAKKTKFCNFIYSNPRPETRNRFFDLLSEYKRVDAGGRVKNNLGYCVGEKKAFLAECKFTIAFENSSHPGYTTEKIVEPMRAGSVPIYWGDPLVHLDFNPASFINYFDHGSLEELVEHVIKVDGDDDLYPSYLREPPFLGNQLPECIRTDLVLDQFDKIFSTPREPIAVRRPRRAPSRFQKKVERFVRRWQDAVASRPT